MKTRNTVKDFTMIIIGTAIIACSVYFFMQPMHITLGSVSGLAMILEEVLPLRMSTISLIINAVLLLFGFLLIGREFGGKTVFTSLLLPVMIGILERVFPETTSPTGDAFIDMICYLFIVSFGQAILFARNASSGGLDIIGKILNKYLRMELGKAIALVGMGVALSSALVYDKKTVVISLLGTYLSGIVLDHFIFGNNVKRRVCIISAKRDQIVDFILNTLHSGATLYEAKGAFTDNNTVEVLTIVDKNEYRQLMDFINKTDPKAFITVYNVNEVIYQPKVIK